MKYFKSVLVVTCIIFFQLTAYASPETHQELVAEYIHLSGISEALASMPEQFEAVFAQRQLVTKSPKAEQKIAEIIQDSFDLAQAEKETSAILLQLTDPQFLEKLNSWLKRPLAQKILNEENESSRPENQGDMLQYISRLQTFPPPQKRIAVMQELEQTTQLSELSSRLTIDIMRGMIGAFNQGLPEDQRQEDQEIAEELFKIKPQLQEGLRQQMVLSSFYIYRNISDDELDEYIQFYKSDIGKHEIAVVGQTLSFVLQNWFYEVSDRLIDLVQENRGIRM